MNAEGWWFLPVVAGFVVFAAVVISYLWVTS